MKIKKFEAGPLMTNCYVVSNENNEGFIVDPVFPDKMIEDYINRNNIIIDLILLTHTHFDHVLGLDYFKRKYDCKVYASEDYKLIDGNPNFSITNQFGDIKIEIDKFLKDEELIEKFSIKALKTPGHSLDSMSFATKDGIFTGDTLFQLSVGRSDFPGGSHHQLIESIISKLLIYEDSTLVYPGHGENTTIGFERINNPFL